jgi:hypothetical protein
VAQIQAVHVHRCTAAHVQQALHHLCWTFQEQGCFATTLLDQGVIPLQVLQGLHFRPTEDHMIFSVRGPRAAIAAFETVRPPYFIDFS